MITFPLVMFAKYSFKDSPNYSRGDSLDISLLNSRRRSFLSLQNAGNILSVPFSLSQLGRNRPLIDLWLYSISPRSIFWIFSPESPPQIQRIDYLGIHLRITLVAVPPIASQQTRACSFQANCLSLSVNYGSVEIKMWFAPYFFRIQTCSYRRTMFIISTPSTGRNRFNILPSDEAAAFIMTAFTPLAWARSSMAIAVKGLTKLIEACSQLSELSTGKHSDDLATAYCEYVPEEATGLNATFLLTRLHPIKPPPFQMTNPLPSKPAMQGAYFTPEYDPA